MLKLRHVNIIAFDGIYCDGAGTFKDALLFCIVMEYARGARLPIASRGASRFRSARAEVGEAVEQRAAPHAPRRAHAAP